jgi:hypothetical protein
VNQQPVSPALSQGLHLQALDAWGRIVDVPATFEYDAGDPWAVRIVFPGGRGDTAEPVRWLVGRELLLEGLTDPVGEGDVQMFPSVDEDGRAAVVMELCSPDGRLVLQLRTRELHRFLARTLTVVPLGTESVDLDELVAALAGRSDAQ